MHQNLADVLAACYLVTTCCRLYLKPIPPFSGGKKLRVQPLLFVYELILEIEKRDVSLSIIIVNCEKR